MNPIETEVDIEIGKIIFDISLFYIDRTVYCVKSLKKQIFMPNMMKYKYDIIKCVR